MPIRAAHLAVVVSVLACALLGFAFSAPTAHADGLTWGSRASIDGAAAATPRRLTRLACPSTSLCFAGDAAGNVLRTHSPQGDASNWTIDHVDGAHAVLDISCPSTQFCVAIDDAGRVLTSSNPDPSTGAPTWQVGVQLITTGQLTRVSCPSTALCVVTDTGGEVITSTDPGDASPTWTATKIAGTRPGNFPEQLTSVSCATTSLCVATDDNGDVYPSTNPAGGASAWPSTLADTYGNHANPGEGNQLEDISCVAGIDTPLCVAVDHTGALISSTNPTNGSSWQAAAPDVFSSFPFSIPIDGVSCPTTSLCVAVDGNGQALSSTSPSSGSWNSLKVASQILTAITCPSASLCLAPLGGQIVSTTKPATTSASDWSTATVDISQPVRAVSCPSSSLCVAGDGSGNLLTTTSPGSSSGAWQTLAVDPGNAINGVSCPTATLCVAVDTAGNALINQTDPTSGGAWNRQPATSAVSLPSISCPTTTLCVAVGTDGDAYTADPSQATPTWSKAYITYLSLQSVSCAAGAGGAVSCVVVTGGLGSTSGSVFVSTDPVSGTWTAPAQGNPIDPSHGLNSVSCTPSVCVAVDNVGNALSTTAPAGTWSSNVIDGGEALTAVSCASSHFCVAMDGDGSALQSSDPQPATGQGTWTSTGVEGRLPLAVSCASSSLCVATDDSAGAVAGTGSAGQPGTGNPGSATPPAGNPGPPLLGGPSGPSIAAVPLSSQSALLSGTVTPEGLPTTAYFRYGLDSSYGAASDGPTYTNSTPPQTLGSDFSSHPVSARVSGLVPNALYHVQLVASNSAGTSYGPDLVFKTKKDPPPPPPVLGKSFDVKPVSGLVFIRLPGVAARDAADHLVSKGVGFVPLTEARQLPTGTQIDARLGAIQLISAASRPHKVQTGIFTGGLYGLAQDRQGLTKGLTTLSLLEGLFPGAPSFSRCTAPAADAAGAQGFLAGLSGTVLQTLHASAHGRFRTRGRFAAATVRGTAWTISDRCNGTLVAVQRHTVAVTDFVRHITVLVREGHHYLAKAPGTRRS